MDSFLTQVYHHNNKYNLVYNNIHLKGIIYPSHRLSFTFQEGGAALRVSCYPLHSRRQEEH